MEKVMAIIGPTAVGKTALSFALAEHYGTDLISGDAYQIYRHMDIGTAKPTADELARYHHYLIDIAEPDEPYSAARFCDMAGKAIAEVNGKGKIPILVGGTGLYVQSLLEGYDFQTARMTEADKEAAQSRIASLSPEGTEGLYRNGNGLAAAGLARAVFQHAPPDPTGQRHRAGRREIFRPGRQGPGCRL